MKHVRSLLTKVAPLRALLEAAVLAIVLWGIVSLFHHSLTSFYTGMKPFTLIGPLCMCVFVARVRIPKLSCRQVFLDVLMGMALSLVLGAIETTFAYVLSIKSPVARFGVALFPFIIIFDFFLNCTIGLFGRIAVRFLVVWDQLRRKHLLWELTHAHVLMLALVAGIIIFAVDSLILIGSHFNSLQALLPVTVFLIIISVIVLIIVVSPIALFSYFVLKRTTNRLKMLTEATGALRQGHYAARVTVDGEDEVAQLQSDFNAMAVDLGRTMKALQEERDRVAALLQERRELIANVSHELRTPVATLRGYLETTLIHWDEVTHADLHHDLQVMEDETIHLQVRVEDLFTLARADVGRLTLKIEPTDVGAVIREIVDVRAPLAWRSSRIDVVAEIPETLPLVLADARRLEQALQNLLHNGIRHTAPGGIVAVVVAIEESSVLIHVKDTGEGIAAKDLQHIWERFYQTDSARTRTGGGSGLGLALVKEWIEGMDGKVAVESVLGEGSCFTLCIPRNPQVEIEARQREMQQSSELR
ncbi:MAG TPA: ATP-binding protein [Ktedonobacteraceae bacterium]|jgi:signal transduction histidine kinase|nr:ATP-binding protein [Ktedonobacteraceae bacterium]